MFFIYDTLTFLLLSVLFAVFYFAIQKLISLKAIASLKIRNEILEGFVGLYFGAITLILKITLNSIVDHKWIPLFIVISSTLIYLRGIPSATVSIFPPLIYYLFQNDTTFYTYLLIGINFLVFAVYEIIIFNTKKKWAGLGIIVTLTTLTTALLIAWILLESKSVSAQLTETTILLPVFLTVFYFPTKWIIDLSISANILFDTTQFVHLSFYRYSLYSNAIWNAISENKINKATYILFKFDFNDQENRYLNLEIHESILQTIKQESGSKSILFNVDENTYGAFVYFDKETESKITMIDQEKIVKRIVDNSNKKYITNNLFTVDTKVKAAATFYGLQSNSINELENRTLFALNDLEMSQPEKMKIFNYKEYRNRIKDSNSFMRMEESLNLNNYMSSFMPIYNIETHETDFNFIDIHTEYEHELLESLDELLRYKKWNFTFDRYFAFEAITNWDNGEGNIYFKYSPITSKEFDFGSLVNRLKKLRVATQKIHFVVSARDISAPRLRTLIKKMKLYNLNIALTDAHLYTQRALENLDIDKIFVSEKYINETPMFASYEYIVFDVSTENSLKNMLSKNIKCIGGKLFNYGNKYTIFDKQSKIYIEDIMSEEKEG